jgi:hypothetical protein
MEDRKELLRNVYDDTTGWLKFIEAKLTAFLTFETGLFYFVAKLVTTTNNKIWIFISEIGIFLAILLIVIALLPQYKQSSNPLYFMTWTRENYHLSDEYSSSNENDYESQIRALATVIKKKMVLLKWSIILYVISIVLFSVIVFL